MRSHLACQSHRLYSSEDNPHHDSTPTTASIVGLSVHQSYPCDRGARAIRSLIILVIRESLAWVRIASRSLATGSSNREALNYAVGIWS